MSFSTLLDIDKFILVCVFMFILLATCDFT